MYFLHISKLPGLKRAISVQLMAVLCLVFLADIPGAASASPLTYYVSPDGNDHNPGTFQKPFATLWQAREAVRASKLDGRTVSVVIRAGVYSLTNSLEFNETDSGTSQAPVTWKVFPGETVRITGGQRISPDVIQPVTDEEILNRVINPAARKNLRQIDLAALGIKDYGEVGPRGFGRPDMPAPLELFIDGQPMPIARWPNPNQPLIPMGKVLDTGSIPRDGEKPIRGGRFIVPTDRPRLWLKANDIWISGFFHTGYADDTVGLASITNSSRGFILSTVQSHLYGFMSGKPWNTWYALNLLEEIDLPGEYAIDRQAGKLYFLPPKDVDPRKAEVMVSTLSQPLFALKGVSYIRFEGMTFECSRGMGISIEDGQDCVVSSCVFRDLGTIGVCLGSGIDPATGHPISGQLGDLNGYLYAHPDFNRHAGSDHRIENCSFYNLGTGGISLGGGDRKTLSAGNNIVSNCVIHTFNRWNRSYKAGVNIDGVGNRIQHCLIYDAPGAAIYLHGNNHVIENNEIHDVMLTGDDMGAIYMGRDPSEFGNIMRDNYFHDIGFGRKERAWAIYYDDGACGSEAFGNIFVRAGSDGTFIIGGGKYNKVHDNIFVDCNSAVYMDNRLQNWAKKSLAKGGLFEQRLNLMKIEQPPFSTQYPELARYWQDKPAVPADPVYRNLLVDCKRLVDGKRKWGPFQDNLEVRADPGFVDMAKGDYQLKPDALAFQKIPGFSPGDFSQMGIVQPVSSR
ncbi:MAG TPA: right-handed parallel beta-helix repeat-containing protein [Pseudomonadales bacterium]|nr:right-handed parallel beta-helix repeat-containing protein [Pseudomonadales bacterium]